jgi:hypothetical protein
MHPAKPIFIAFFSGPMEIALSIRTSLSEQILELLRQTDTCPVRNRILKTTTIGFEGV